MISVTEEAAEHVRVIFFEESAISELGILDVCSYYSYLCQSMLVFISNSICSPAFRTECRCKESDRGISQCDESKSTWLRDYLPILQ